MNGAYSRPAGRFVYRVHEDAWEWDDDVYRIHGLEPGSIRPTTELIHASKHPDDLERVKAVLEGAARDGGSFAVAYRLLRADGTERQVVLIGCGDPGDPGDPGGHRVEVVEGYYIDLTKDFAAQIREETHRAVAASAETRATIEQAKGVLMMAYGVSADGAFAMLEWWSRNHNVKVRDLAARLMASTQSQPIVKGLHLSLDKLLFDLTNRWADGEGRSSPDGIFSEPTGPRQKT